MKSTTTFGSIYKMEELSNLKDIFDNFRIDLETENWIDEVRQCVNLANESRIETLTQMGDEEISQYDDSASIVEVDGANDAAIVQKFQTKRFCKTQISLELLQNIETSLDFYEKVALVFLLYENEDLALQRLRAAELNSQVGLVYDWAAQQSPNWADKLLEALCIIQNYQAIEKLGYSKEELNTRFLPDNKHTAVFVDHMRKLLYKICDSLTVEQTKRMLDIIEQELRCNNSHIDRSKFNPQMCELTLLYLMSQKFIKIKKPIIESDISLIICSLKRLGNIDDAEYLNTMVSNEAPNKKNEKICISNSTSDCSNRENLSSPNSYVLSDEISLKTDSSDFYHINENNVGLCIIINQRKFHREEDPSWKSLLPSESLETRHGTNLDCNRLAEAFGCLGCTVMIFEDLSHENILNKVKHCATTLIKKEHSCFVLCILSHGIENAVYGSNSIPVPVEEIEKNFQGLYCPALINKPKLILIQACQGTTRQKALFCDIATDSPGEKASTIPEVSDMITFWSTVPGYAAFRDKIRGSWFVKALWKELIEDGHKSDINTLFTRVIRHVTSQKTIMDGDYRAMTPRYSSTFRRALKFPYLPQSRAIIAQKLFERVMYNVLRDEFLILIDSFYYKNCYK